MILFLFPGVMSQCTHTTSRLADAISQAVGLYKAGAQVVLSARRVEELERVKGTCMEVEGGEGLLEPIVLALDLSK